MLGNFNWFTGLGKLASTTKGKEDRPLDMVGYGGLGKDTGQVANQMLGPGVIGSGSLLSNSAYTGMTDSNVFSLQQPGKFQESAKPADAGGGSGGSAGELVSEQQQPQQQMVVQGGGGGGGGMGWSGGNANQWLDMMFNPQTTQPQVTDPMYEAFAKLGKLQMGLTPDEVNSIFSDPNQRLEAINYMKENGDQGLIADVMKMVQGGAGLQDIQNTLLPGMQPSAEGMFGQRFDQMNQQMTQQLPGMFDAAYNPVIESLEASKGIANNIFDTRREGVDNTYDFMLQVLDDRLKSASSERDFGLKTLDEDAAAFLGEVVRQRDARVAALEKDAGDVSAAYNMAMVDAKETQKSLHRQQRNIFGNLNIMESSAFIEARSTVDNQLNNKLLQLNQSKVDTMQEFAQMKDGVRGEAERVRVETERQKAQAKERVNMWYASLQDEIKTSKVFTVKERGNQLDQLEQQRLAAINQVDQMSAEAKREKILGLYSATREAENTAYARAGQSTMLALEDWNNQVLGLINQAAGGLVSEAQIAAAQAAGQEEMAKFMLNYEMQVSKVQAQWAASSRANDPMKQLMDELRMEGMILGNQESQSKQDNYQINSVLTPMISGLDPNARDNTQSYNQMLENINQFADAGMDVTPYVSLVENLFPNQGQGRINNNVKQGYETKQGYLK